MFVVTQISKRKGKNAKPSSAVVLRSVNDNETSIEMAEEAVPDDEVDTGAKRPGLMTRALSTILPGTVPYGTIEGDEDSSRNGGSASNLHTNGGGPSFSAKPGASRNCGKADKAANDLRAPGGQQQSSCSIS